GQIPWRLHPGDLVAISRGGHDMGDEPPVHADEAAVVACVAGGMTHRRVEVGRLDIDRDYPPSTVSRHRDEADATPRRAVGSLSKQPPQTASVFYDFHGAEDRQADRPRPFAVAHPDSRGPVPGDLVAEAKRLS